MIIFTVFLLDLLLSELFHLLTGMLFRDADFGLTNVEFLLELLLMTFQLLHALASLTLCPTQLLHFALGD